MTETGQLKLLKNNALTANSTYPKVAVQWLNQALCFYQSLCTFDNEVLRNRHLWVAVKRYALGMIRYKK